MRQRWMKASGRRRVGYVVAGIAAMFLLIQAIPYGRDHADPQPTKQVHWTNAKAKAAFDDGCADCHSDQTDWRWYSNVAPVSWLIQRDVNDGRSAMNLSEWDKAQPELGDIVEQISSGEMPPLQYKVGHPQAKLSAAEKQQLIDGFRAIYATDPPAATKSGGG